MGRYIFAGCNDEAEYCTCCGKTGLKKVVWLRENTEDELSQPSPFGVVCAARLLGVKNPTSTKAKREIEDAQEQANRAMRLKEWQRVFDAAIVDSYSYGYNKFNVPRFTAIVNGLAIDIDGFHVTNGTCTLDSLCRAARNLYAERICPVYRKA